ncbi:hypothetical protein L7F22_046916 [Adiantum nelumboides]|nr:hypothetical protein [Adiantum nelumboides]
MAEHNSTNQPSSTWILDTGATYHLTSQLEWLSHYHPLSQPFDVRFGNNGIKHALGVGTAHIQLSDGKVVAINHVYYVPRIAKNLISVSKITSADTTIEFGHNYSILRHHLSTGYPYSVVCPKIGRLYILGQTMVAAEVYSSIHKVDNSYKTILWHYHLAHLNITTMKLMAKLHSVSNYSLASTSLLSLCEACIFGKLANQKYPSRSHRTSRPLQLIHSDLCGPLPKLSLAQNRYFLTFIDDYTRLTEVSFLPDKTSASVLSSSQAYHKLVENQLQHRITSLQTDNGSEYTSGIFKAYCKDHGIYQRFTVPKWPGSACYVQNRVYHRSIAGIPYILWFRKPLDYSNLRIFSCPAYAFIPSGNRDKLSDHATKALFVGYGDPHEVKGFRLHDPTTRRFFFSRSVIFDETSLISVPASTNVSTDPPRLALPSPD